MSSFDAKALAQELANAYACRQPVNVHDINPIAPGEQWQATVDGLSLAGAILQV